MVGGEDGLGAVCAELFVAAVVEEDYVAAADVCRDFAFYNCCGRGVPVVAGYVPHDGLEAEFAGDAENGWAAASEGRAEEIRVLTGGVLDGVATLGEFLPDFTFAFERQQRMGKGVVADGVAGLQDFADDFRALADIAADHEKSAFSFVFG